MAPRKRKEDIFEQDPNRILDRSLEEVMHNSIIPYAEYVIMERALPRVEDGLKPVQRRILYTMYELGITPDKPHRKSARIVGDTLGKYHPHGDTSVYDAMVRMAQDFTMRAMLIDGHGNFGSMDGDSAAAMRYTEARLTPLAMEMLRDIEKDTVPFSLNFDDTLKEPDVLPGRFPNILVNGAYGIAVGVATNIPPHNLGEIIDAVIAQMEEPDIPLKKLMEYVPGPDFPTRGIIIGQDGIKEAYETGKGKMVVRAKVEIENLSGGKKQLVITEIPYQINKASMLEKILKLRETKKGILTGISDIRDESDRDGIRAVIELKRDADEEKILNYLYKYSDLQVSYGINMVVIADGKPQQLGLKAILDYYIKHQKDVVRKRTQFDLDKAKAREHILEGLMLAIQNIDKVISIIRSSRNPKEARERLMEEFGFTEVQAQAILDMRLQKLTNLEIKSLENEYKAIQKLIKELTAILESEAQLIKVIKKELLEIKKNYADDRRTKIIADSVDSEIKEDDFIFIEDIIITLTHNQDIKRVPIKSFNRSSRDVEAVETREMDYIEFLVESSTGQKILFFTDQGNCYCLNGNEIPEGKWKDKGVPISSLLNGFGRTEKVVAVIPIIEFSDKQFVQFYTEGGMIKKTALSEYDVKKSKIKACGLREDDRVIGAELCSEEKDILLITLRGMSIRFHGSEVNPMGRSAIGVKAIQLKSDDRVLAAHEIDDEGEIVVLTDRGYAKRTLASDYQVQGRGGIGFKTITFTRNRSNGGVLINSFYVKDPIEIIIQQKDGTVTRFNTESLEIQKRDDKGQDIVPAILGNDIIASYRNYNEA